MKSLFLITLLALNIQTSLADTQVDINITTGKGILKDILIGIGRDSSGHDRGPVNMGYLSYGGCATYADTFDFRDLAAATGRTALEAETNTRTLLSRRGLCKNFKIVRAEQITTSRLGSYCTAACQKYYGPDEATIRSGRGRNKNEARYNAIKAVSQEHQCRGIQLLRCE
jgi:hypothetical protein